MDIDSLFAEATVARTAATSCAAPKYTATQLDEAIAHQIRLAWNNWCIETNQPSCLYRPHSERCSKFYCTGKRVTVQLYATANVNDAGETLLSSEFLDADGRRVHACSLFCVERDNADLHVHNCSDYFVEQGSRVARPDNGLYACNIHARLHRCDANCQETETDALGFSVCVLSGIRIKRATCVAFGDGTNAETEQIGSKKSNGPRRVDAGRRTKSHAYTVPHGQLQNVNGTELVQDNAQLQEKPLFSDQYSSNTFGDGLREYLTEIYTCAYDVVQLLLFSAERMRIEQHTEQLVHTSICKKLAAYIKNEARHTRPVHLDMCQRIIDRETKRRRCYPRIYVRDGARDRLSSYYAMIVVEFYVQLMYVEKQLSDHNERVRRNKRKRDAGNAKATTPKHKSLETYSFRSVVPIVLALISKGFGNHGQILIERNNFLAIMPETSTIHQLGFVRKTGTHIQNVIKQTIAFALEAKIDVRQLQTTTLQTVFIMDGSESVIDEFLRARRNRISAL